MLNRMPWVEVYVACLLSKEVYSPMAIRGQYRMKKATSRASKNACTKASMSMVTATQLDYMLANAWPPSPPQDPAASAAWHHKNGLALPDHLQTNSSSTSQGDGPAAENMPAKPADTPHMNPQALPSPYIDVPMGDTEDILDWEPDPLLDQS
jgi:hypothetical protein